METPALKFIDFISSQINYERAWLRKVHFLYSKPFNENTLMECFEGWEITYHGKRKLVIRNLRTFDEVCFRARIEKKMYFSINDEIMSLPATVEEFISLAQSKNIRLKWKSHLLDTFKRPEEEEISLAPPIPMYQ